MIYFIIVYIIYLSVHQRKIFFFLFSLFYHLALLLRAFLFHNVKYFRNTALKLLIRTIYELIQYYKPSDILSRTNIVSEILDLVARDILGPHLYK